MFMNTPKPAAIIGPLTVLLVLDVAAVFLRFYTRRRLRQPLRIDDWLTVPALILIFGLSSIMFYGIGTHSLGYPAPPTPGMDKRSAVDASDWTIVTARKLEYSFLTIFAATNGIVKLSVLFLYRRIFVVDKNWKDLRNFFMLLMITLIGLWSVSYVFAFMFMCKGKFEVLFYDLEAAALQCVDTFMVGYSCSISDFVGDVLIILIPIPFIWKLQLPLNKKVAVLTVFLTGTLASAASLIRMLWMIWATKVGYDPTMDEELLLTTELFWCLMEITLGLIAACLPTLRGLFKTHSVDSVVKNVRNILSLRSTSSGSLKSTSNLPGKNSNSIDRDVSITVETKYDDASWRAGRV